MELLPEVEQRQLRSGKLIDGAVTSNEVVEHTAKFDAPEIQDTRSTSLLIPSSANASLVPQTDDTTGLLRSSTFETSKTGRPFTAIGPELGNFGSPSYFRELLLTNKERVQQRQGSIGKNLNKSTPRNQRVRPRNGSLLKGINGISPGNSQDDELDIISPGIRGNNFHGHIQSNSPVYPWKATTNSVTRTTLNHSKESANALLSNMSSRNVQSHKDGTGWNMVPSDDPMDVSWRLESIYLFPLLLTAFLLFIFSFLYNYR